ncbi:MAG: DNA-protecting protein DprA [Paraglaciecola sp.]|nr:DNA-protecting protein DprA [Paraglaciecola sp.]NCT49801.1 DNA-protecting protein DprA [Paraglaciecola sp.]
MQQDVDARQNEDSLAEWLTLVATPGLGVARLEKLLTHFSGNVSNIFKASASDLIECGMNQLQIDAILQPNQTFIRQSLAWLAADSNHFALPIDHPLYPPLLKQTASPPLILFARGQLSILSNPQLAIVGSRNPSHSGKTCARSFARDLAACGWTITSGMALGIDALAHLGALDAQGNTIAVMGCGIDAIYPKKHAALAASILANQGLIISEFAPNSPAKPENFPRRNRIISGLSLGTLVVEAALKSGSLITARYALEQNREVFAIPGNIFNPMAQGCHHLIQQGAKLITSVQDINEEFELFFAAPKSSSSIKSQKNSQQSLATERLLDSVDFEATPLDIVAERSGMTLSEVMSQLLEYELRGLVTAVPGGYVKLGEK